MRHGASKTAFAALMSIAIATAFALQVDQKSSDQQNNHKSDIAVTSAIRREVIADKTLSVAAHNVKIITENGLVTLRGQVRSDQEKAGVVAKAALIAGPDNVGDHLTVQKKKQKN
jgi:hyperosmotically inducible protein